MGRMKEKLNEILRPSGTTIILTALLFLGSLLFIVSSMGTSMVSWDQFRGAPFTALQTERYAGPCRDAPYCIRVTIDEIYPIAFFADMAFWYFISAVAVLGLRNIISRIKIHSTNFH
jgi:hypothetical protein